MTARSKSGQVVNGGHGRVGVDGVPQLDAFRDDRARDGRGDIIVFHLVIGILKGKQRVLQRDFVAFNLGFDAAALNPGDNAALPDPVPFLAVKGGQVAGGPGRNGFFLQGGKGRPAFAGGASPTAAVAKVVSVMAPDFSP
jgi:hypothetical protein